MGERETEVKPCPWCGSTMPPTQRETDGAKWGALTCAECSAVAPEVRTGYGPPETWYADALAAWNERRAPAPSEAVAGDESYPFGPADADLIRLAADNLRDNDLSTKLKTLAFHVEHAHPAPAREVTEAMVVKAKMAMEGWRGDSHRYACLDLFRRGEDGMVRLHRALTAALTPDAEGGR